MCFFNIAERPILRKRAYLHLEIPKLQKVFLSKLTQFSKGKNMVDAPASNTDGFFERFMCFFS
jgi:hypothetical protein